MSRLALAIGAAVVPGGLDERSAGVGVPGLGNGPLGPGSAGGMFGGDEPQIGADSAAGESGPVADFHCQADGGEQRDSAQTHQRADHGSVAFGRSEGRDLRIQTVPAVQRQFRRLQTGLVGGPQGRIIKLLPVQPGVVGISPGLAAGVDQTMRRRSFEILCLALIRSPRTSSRARTRSRAASSAWPAPARVLSVRAGPTGPGARRRGRRSSPGLRAAAEASRVPQPGTRSLHWPVSGPVRSRSGLLRRHRGPGPAIRKPSRRSRHRSRPTLSEDLARFMVNRAALDAACMDIETYVGTLIHGWNLQTFKCGSASPHPAPTCGKTWTGNPRNSLNPRFQSYVGTGPHFISTRSFTATRCRRRL